MQAIYIWIGGDLPSPHNVSSQLPNVTGTKNYLRAPEIPSFLGPEALFDLNRDNPTDIPDVVRMPERFLGGNAVKAP